MTVHDTAVVWGISSNTFLAIFISPHTEYIRIKVFPTKISNPNPNFTAWVPLKITALVQVSEFEDSYLIFAISSFDHHMSKTGIMKTAMNKTTNQQSANPGLTGSNPFDSDTDSDQNQTLKPTRTSAHVPSKENLRTSLLSYNEEEERGAYSSASSSSHSISLAAKNQYKNDFRDWGGLQNQTVTEMEGYAVYKAEETTKQVNSCLKIAEDIREDATTTLITLHQQGEQITRTHMVAADMDHDLSRGEKLLGSLGGLFSKTWKPKKTRTISGPVITRDDPIQRKGNHLEQKERLGIGRSAPMGQSNPRQYSSEPSNALEKVEKAKQDDTLSDLSNVLGQLKDMAVDMGSEIERQNTGLDHLHDDVEELNFRVKGVTQRGRRLLGK
ncbi:SNAP25 homologous protein SNAP33-like isoform X3 [Tasmannia lanceolata]|uniref:SNAP25 homologous protein SNAP33-like isoform X3 n=1 Tax=Tasmannia lanceolata TaxID=3420 RepID=UPI0040628237